MANIYNVVTALHQGVREAIEKQYDCQVTSIESTAETCYVSPLSSVVPILGKVVTTFRVEARQGAVAMAYKVAVDNSGAMRIVGTEMRLR